MTNGTRKTLSFLVNYLNMLHELITATKILLAPEALVVAAGPHLPQVTLHVDLKLRVPEVKLLVADVADINLDPGMNILL